MSLWFKPGWIAVLQFCPVLSLIQMWVYLYTDRRRPWGLGVSSAFVPNIYRQDTIGLSMMMLVTHRLTNAFGLLLLFQGIASVIGPPVIGKR